MLRIHGSSYLLTGSFKRYEKAKRRSGIVQGGVGGGNPLRGGAGRRSVRGNRLGQRQGALHLPATGARQADHANARGPGGRKNHPPPVGLLVRPFAEGADLGRAKRPKSLPSNSC